MFGMLKKKPTIFVQIASYRDPECQWTVKDLFEKAEFPDRINVGICWQCDRDLDKDCFIIASPLPKQTKTLFFHPSQAEGVCWARAEAQKLYDGEDYVLMIDSHMRFIDKWDTALIAELKRCESDKPFLSNYPPGYKPPDKLEANPLPVVMRAKQFTENGDIRFEGEYLGGPRPEKPLKGAFLAGGFLFAAGKFIREVPYDPYMYFDHEEITLVVRSYTHGWDSFSPTTHFVYHFYNEPQKGEKRALHWVDRKDWAKFQVQSRERYNYLLAGIEPKDRESLKDIEKYGLGKRRTLADFEAFTGIDFKKKFASDRARNAEFIEGLDRYRRKAAPADSAKTAQPLTNAPPVSRLAPGDMLPQLQIRDEQGVLRGAPVPGILCLLPSGFDAYMQEFFDLYRARQEEFARFGVPLLFVAAVSSAPAAAALRQKYNAPQPILADAGGALWRVFGIADAAMTPFSCAQDATRKILALCDNRNAQNHMGDLLRAAETLATAGPRS